MLRRLLLLPLLACLLAVSALALLNPRPAVALRLLIWSSPALPLGSWLAIAVGGGGLLSAAATAAALQNPAALRRQVRLRSPNERHRAQTPPLDSPPASATWDAAAASAGPPRPPGAPPPTVEVPFRVICRGGSSDRGPVPEPVAAAPAPAAPGARAVGDGWDAPASDDW